MIIYNIMYTHIIGSCPLNKFKHGHGSVSVGPLDLSQYSWEVPVLAMDTLQIAIIPSQNKPDMERASYYPMYIYILYKYIYYIYSVFVYGDRLWFMDSDLHAKYWMCKTNFLAILKTFSHSRIKLRKPLREVLAQVRLLLTPNALWQGPYQNCKLIFFRAAQFKNNLQTGFMKLGISLIKNVMMQKDPRMDGYWDGNRRRFFGELPPWWIVKSCSIHYVKSHEISL